MTQTPIDFHVLKSEIQIADVIQQYGIPLRATGGELRGQCPLPTHTSDNSHNSFSVNLERNLWCCQSMSCTEARGGKLGGTVLDLVADMEGCSVREAAEHLREWFGDGRDRRASTRVPAPAQTPNLPLRFHLRDVDHLHPYLESRGVTAATARSFGAGYYGGAGMLHGRVVIPIRNERSDLIAYAGRSIAGEEPKYRFPAGFHKSQVLFNLNRARYSGGRTVVVVEGFFDAMKVHQAGFRNVVGLMGSSLSADQSALLEKHFRRAVLMLDGDPAGARAATGIGERLRNTMEVDVVSLRPGQQPDQLTAGELRGLLSARSREFRGIGR